MLVSWLALDCESSDPSRPMIVQAVKRHRATGEVRAIGAVYHASPETGRHVIQCGLARLVADHEDWHTPHGRELRTEPLTDTRWPTVVACLNIWNDRPALEQTLPTWADRVDHLVVADGPYASVKATGHMLSDDGLWPYLKSIAVPFQSLVPTSRPWVDQITKRSQLLALAAELHPGALLLIVDADEFVSGDTDLHDAPEGDVLWVNVTSPLYQRPYSQPRLVRAHPGLRYAGRHHWLYAGDRLLATHQYGGAGVEHRLVPLTLRNARGLGHTPARALVKRSLNRSQDATERQAATPQGAQSDAAMASREALRLAAYTDYDPGLVGFRLHTAINTTTPHASLYFRRGKDNPYQAPRQYDVDAMPGLAKECADQADVVHCHLDYAVLDAIGGTKKPIVIHHHGTQYRTQAAHWNTVDARRAKLRLVSNLELLSYGEHLHWLPNPVSVARLRRLREQVRDEEHLKWLDVEPIRSSFRVAHSPSKRHLKGTQEFLDVCEKLRAKNINIEPVLIEGMEHGAGLRLKASCDACFDSFWLGLQCSGIEAGAMGMPVIAGDATVRDRYVDLIGYVPYTFAADAASLEVVLEQIVADDYYRAEESMRLSAYVEQWHDDAAVALRYLDLLDTAIGWRKALTLGAKPVPKRRGRERKVA